MTYKAVNSNRNNEDPSEGPSDETHPDSEQTDSNESPLVAEEIGVNWNMGKELQEIYNCVVAQVESNNVPVQEGEINRTIEMKQVTAEVVKHCVDVPITVQSPDSDVV